MICSEKLSANSPVALIFSNDEDYSLGSFGIVVDDKTILTTSLIFVSLETGEIDVESYNKLSRNVSGKGDELHIEITDLDSPPVCQKVMQAPALEQDIIDVLVKYKERYLQLLNKGSKTTDKDLDSFFNYTKKEAKNIKRIINRKHVLSCEDFIHTIIGNIDYNVLVELERFEYQIVLDYPYVHLKSKIDGLKTLKTPVTNIFTKNFAKLLGESISKSPAVRAMLGLKLIPNKYEL